TQTKAQILASILLNGTHTTSLPGGAPHLTKEEFDTALDIWFNGHPETNQEAHKYLPTRNDTITLPPRTAEVGTSSSAETLAPRTVNIGIHVHRLVNIGRTEITERSHGLLKPYGTVGKRNGKWVLEIADPSGRDRTRRLPPTGDNGIYAPPGDKKAKKFETALEVWLNGHPESGQEAHEYLPKRDDTVRIPVDDPDGRGGGTPEKGLITVNIGYQVRDIFKDGRVSVTERTIDLLRRHGNLKREGNRWFLKRHHADVDERLADLRAFFGDPKNAESDTPKNLEKFFNNMTGKGLLDSEKNRPLRAYLSERFNVVDRGDYFVIERDSLETLPKAVLRAFVADVRVFVGRLERYFGDPGGSGAVLRGEVVEDVGALVGAGRSDDVRNAPIKA
ncbi:hypothetical protein, partial [Streptomyces sp. NPDC056160]|uniref:hypothetical protein n=1 Tax=Streptomyces sp. NPDC056160 TaxID=3345731 RepID=UPI0035E0722B